MLLTSSGMGCEPSAEGRQMLLTSSGMGCEPSAEGRQMLLTSSGMPGPKVVETAPFMT